MKTYRPPCRQSMPEDKELVTEDKDRVLTDEEKERLKKLVNKHERMIFMKGTPKLPMCDYGGKMIQVVKDISSNFETFDILDDNFVREGLKIYSNWPTYPQLYVRGKFIGGLDTVLELQVKQELKGLVE